MEEELKKLREWVSFQYYDLSVNIDALKLIRKIEKLIKKAGPIDEDAWKYRDLNN